MYAYLYQTLSARYFVFLQGLKLFWDKILTDVMPTDKIRILQLKSQLFSAVEVLKQRYVQQNVVKQLCSLRLQISEVLQDTQ
jgi:hypothetical protein